MVNDCSIGHHYLHILYFAVTYDEVFRCEVELVALAPLGLHQCPLLVRSNAA